MSVLGSGGNGVKKFGEQGVWFPKDQGARESNLVSREQRNMGTVSNKVA